MSTDPLAAVDRASFFARALRTRPDLPGSEEVAEVLDALVERLVQAEAVNEAASEVMHEYDLWAEDANDGEFAIWSRDNFMAAFVKLRKALASIPKEEETDG